MGKTEIVLVILACWFLFGLALLLSPSPDFADRMTLACLVGGVPPVLWCAGRLIHFVFLRRPHL